VGGGFRQITIYMTNVGSLGEWGFCFILDSVESLQPCGGLMVLGEYLSGQVRLDI
jgi:hypothetical protein